MDLSSINPRSLYERKKEIDPNIHNPHVPPKTDGGPLHPPSATPSPSPTPVACKVIHCRWDGGFDLGDYRQAVDPIGLPIGGE